MNASVPHVNIVAHVITTWRHTAVHACQGIQGFTVKQVMIIVTASISYNFESIYQVETLKNCIYYFVLSAITDYVAWND